MKKHSKKPKSEFEQKLIDLARVTRVVRGGRRFRFRATVAVGNHKGKIGLGLAKGMDVSDAISKAFNQAKKNVVQVPIHNGTIPHQVSDKYKSAKVLLKPAKKGNGIVVGGSVRQIVELSGIKDLSAKILGKGSKINNAYAALKALESLNNTVIKKPANFEKTNQSKKTKDQAKPAGRSKKATSSVANKPKKALNRQSMQTPSAKTASAKTKKQASEKIK
ncbi:MAG: 30S ribosomal protein S5 [Candidatus Moranbacteria bacterium]|nr:30S ribosomal protein S5 [Candidatus Moranbacteria bacterium]